MFVEDIIKFKKLGLGGDTPTPPTPSSQEDGSALHPYGFEATPITVEFDSITESE